MNILVTGGCGFIGSHFIELLLEKYPEDTIINVDSLTYAAHPDMPAHLAELGRGRYRFIEADIASPNLAKLLRGIDVEALVNFAAETHVDRSILDPGSFVRTNILGVQNLLAYAREYGVRFVHVSTDEVYGSLAPESATSTETSILDPNSPYAASKASADLLALAHQRTYGQEVLITRCTNNYGPYQFPEKLLPLLIANAVEDKPIPVYGDGRQVRDWIYVVDHCRGIDLVLRNGRSGEVYNISASEERHNIDVVQLVLDKMGKSRTLIQYVGDRPAHDRRYGLNAGKIRSELGWAPSVTFDEGISKTIRWYEENSAWWKKVRGADYLKYYQANYKDKFAAPMEGQV